MTYYAPQLLQKGTHSSIS